MHLSIEKFLVVERGSLQEYELSNELMELVVLKSIKMKWILLKKIN